MRIKNERYKMRKLTLSVFTKVLYVTFIISTIVTLFLVLKHADSTTAFIFIMWYLALSLFMIVYFPLIIIINAKGLKWTSLKKRLLKFLAMFTILVVLNFGFDYFFRPTKVDLLREFTVAFGIALGSTFTDVLFQKRNRNS